MEEQGSWKIVYKDDELKVQLDPLNDSDISSAYVQADIKGTQAKFIVAYRTGVTNEPHPGEHQLWRN